MKTALLAMTLVGLAVSAQAQSVPLPRFEFPGTAPAPADTAQPAAGRAHAEF